MLLKREVGCGTLTPVKNLRGTHQQGVYARMKLALDIMLGVFSIGLILVVLLQSGKSAGLSGAIGGGAEQLMGKAKARGIDGLLNKLTVGLAVVFMVLALLTGYFIK